MWDVDPEWARPALMKAVLRSFLERGGQIFQGNATSVAELERALERPEDYPNLMVRVGGYSARFTSLDRALQEEIVRRHRHRG
jgi:formate C-acetyltransferase